MTFQELKCDVMFIAQVTSYTFHEQKDDVMYIPVPRKETGFLISVSICPVTYVHLDFFYIIIRDHLILPFCTLEVKIHMHNKYCNLVKSTLDRTSLREVMFSF